MRGNWNRFRQSLRLFRSDATRVEACFLLDKGALNELWLSLRLRTPILPWEFGVLTHREWIPIQKDSATTHPPRAPLPREVCFGNATTFQSRNLGIPIRSSDPADRVWEPKKSICMMSLAARHLGRGGSTRCGKSSFQMGTSSAERNGGPQKSSPFSSIPPPERPLPELAKGRAGRCWDEGGESPRSYT